MPYTMEDLIRETIDELVQTYPDEFLERLPVAKRLEGIPVETPEVFLQQLVDKGSSSDLE
jgi:hypothetical protein